MRCGRIPALSERRSHFRTRGYLYSNTCGVQTWQTQGRRMRYCTAHSTGNVPGRDVVLRHTGRISVLWGNTASYQGGVYAGTAETSGRYCRRDAPALPEKAYAQGKADESLQCLFFEGYLSAGALRKENRRRLFAENAGDNGVKMP